MPEDSQKREIVLPSATNDGLCLADLVNPEHGPQKGNTRATRFAVALWPRCCLLMSPVLKAFNGMGTAQAHQARVLQSLEQTKRKPQKSLMKSVRLHMSKST